MHFNTLISGVYGTLRGYRRIAIRRAVSSARDLSPEELARGCSDAFSARVRAAIDRFPAYARAVEEHAGRLPGASGPLDPGALPVWTRERQRAFFDAQEQPADTAYTHQTSGSTSLPVRFHVTRESYEWRTAVMDRGYSWARAEEGRRSVHVWAAPRGPAPRSLRIKRGVHRVLQRRVYFDAFRAFGEPEFRACCDLINAFRPESIVGYTGLVVDLARFARAHPGSLRHRAATFVSAAEGLESGQRELLREHVVDDVFLTYGSREFMNIGMECEHHTGYHLATDNLYVEVVDETGRPVEPGRTGRVLVTDLHNAATPFIRYEIGDLATMAPPDELCPCGRPFPLLRSVDGRRQDMIVRGDGTRVTALFVTFAMRQFEWIEGWQVVQHGPGRITVRVLSAQDPTKEAIGPLEALLRRELGADARITIERVNELERRTTGKVALVIDRSNG